MLVVPHYPAFARTVDNTHALQVYAHRIWRRHEATLAHAVAREMGVSDDDSAPAALALFALGTVEWAYARADPLIAFDVSFALIEHGWSAMHPNVQ